MLSVPRASPPRTAAATYQSFVEADTPEFAAAQGQVSAQSLIGDIEGAVSEESIAQGVTEELDEKATLKFQMGELFKSFEEGKPPPPWAAPAVRAAGAMMAQRGMGKSSMAAAAITQAMMESGISIAKEDANKYRGLLSLNQSIYTANCEPNTVIMHPLPRDSRSDANELDRDLYANPNLAIFRQADNGVVIRMAMFALVLGVEDKIEKTAKPVNWKVGLSS